MLLSLACCLACAPAPRMQGAIETAKAPPLPAVSAVPATSATSPSVAQVASPDGARVPTVGDTPPAEPPLPKEPRFVERLAHLRGRLVYSDGAPAPHLPVAIDNGCETLAGFTDARGRFAFDDVALPARFRSLESFQLWSGREEDERAGDEVSIEPSSLALPANQGPAPRQVRSGATREIAAPITIQGPAVVYLANHPGTQAATYFMNGIDLWGMGPNPGTVIGAAGPEKVEIARKLGLTVAVLYGDPNDMAADARNPPSDEPWVQTVNERVKAARAAWKLAELGESRKPRSRVRVDPACVKRASAGNLPPSGNERQAP